MNASLTELRKKHALLKKRKDLKKKFGLLYYCPHPKQDAFHRAADFKFRLLESGNRFGKSDCGAAEDCAFALGERPWYPKEDPRRYLGIPRKPNKILIVCADWDKVEEIFSGDGTKGDLGKLWKFLPREKAEIVGRASTGSINKIKVESIWGGYSVIHFDTRKSFAVNAMGSESSNWDFIHVDEPITQQHWKAVSRGLVDTDGKAAFTCTNLDQPWISDFFRTKPKRKNDLQTILVDGRKSRWVLRGSMHDNPYLTPEAIAEYSADLTEDEKQCRINGIPLHLTGMVYKEFNENVHVLSELPPGWSAWNDPPKDWTIFCALDTHPNTPHAALFAAVDPNDFIYFYEERFEAETAKELAQWVKSKTAGRNAISYQLEPGAYVPDPASKIVFADVLTKEGLPFVKAIKDLKGGILNAKEYLKFKRCFFVPTLERTLWEINHYTWEIKDGLSTNKPIDKDDHMMENFYRILLRHPTYSEPLNEHNSVVEPSEITSELAFGGAFDAVEEDDWSYCLTN